MTTPTDDELLAWLNQATFATKADEDACRAAILALHERHRAEVERLTRKAEHDMQSVIRSANALASQLEHQRDAAESALAAAQKRIAVLLQDIVDCGKWTGNVSKPDEYMLDRSAFDRLRKSARAALAGKDARVTQQQQVKP